MLEPALPSDRFGWSTLVGAAAFVWVAVLPGCAAAAPRPERPVVLATTTVLADIARNVAGHYLDVESLVTPGTEIHTFEPGERDRAHAAAADLIVANGLGLEQWFDRLNPGGATKHVAVGDGTVPIPLTEGAHAEEDNPHAWMSPIDAEISVDNIADAFADLDSDHAEAYRENATSYKSQLQAAQDDVVRAFAPLTDHQRILVTCEGAFSYLARDAGFREAGLWPLNDERSGDGAVRRQSSQDAIARIEDFVRLHRVPAVFCESTVPDDIQRQVAAATGARFGGVLYVDSLSDANGPAPTFVDLLRYDARTIADQLSRP